MWRVSVAITTQHQPAASIISTKRTYLHSPPPRHGGCAQNITTILCTCVLLAAIVDTGMDISKKHCLFHSFFLVKTLELVKNSISMSCCCVLVLV